MKQYKKIAQSIYLFRWKKLKVGFRFCRDETTLAYGFPFLLDCESETELWNYNFRQLVGACVSATFRYKYVYTLQHLP